MQRDQLKEVKRWIISQIDPMCVGSAYVKCGFSEAERAIATDDEKANMDKEEVQRKASNELLNERIIADIEGAINARADKLNRNYGYKTNTLAFLRVPVGDSDSEEELSEAESDTEMGDKGGRGDKNASHTTAHVVSPEQKALNESGEKVIYFSDSDASDADSDAEGSDGEGGSDMDEENSQNSMPTNSYIKADSAPMNGVIVGATTASRSVPVSVEKAPPLSSVVRPSTKSLSQQKADVRKMKLRRAMHAHACKSPSKKDREKTKLKMQVSMCVCVCVCVCECVSVYVSV